MPSRTRVALLYVAIMAGVACGGSKPVTATPAPETHPLAGIAGQNIVVVPVQSLRMPAEGRWPGLPASRPTLAKLDSVIADTLKDRVGNRGWVYTDDLLKAAAN